MALPAAPESIPAKALACAWMEWVAVEEPSQPRDAYGPADQLVYDIHATVMARDIVPAGAPLPNLLTAAGIDLKAMTVRDLIALQSSMNLLGDVADAISCQPKSMTGNKWNAAGSMVNWLGNDMSDATEAVAAELRTREASDRIEQGQRLANLAPAILEGGDPAATLALAQEILAAVEV
jgi:hypothetical protein